MIFDSHLHTKFSTDSKMDIEDAVKKAKELNIGLIITEHMDLKYPIKGNFIFNPEDYFNEYNKYRNSNTLLGIELGMRSDCVEENRQIIESFPFDYVIGSIHLVDTIDIFREDFYAGRTKKETYEQYLTCMLECLKSHNFIDSLGHIDYITRYARYEDKEIYYDDFSEYIDEVLKTAVVSNIPLEINTRRLRYKVAADSLLKIYRRFYEVGGRQVTIGSDAHNAAAIGNNINIALEIADRCNLKPVYFKERKMEYMK
ncbi:histidinol phosphate phosphatase [Clostridium sp. YIM B02515]|uniref:Histidinol-phosphatase n=1 Tax=Clostridium rhizosphaerae TaxID=2803861 RepID=A0ABS1TFP0_9CLOT|nr:histidinol phosphate phosphatase [Clostridium rhizosphaerae]